MARADTKTAQRALTGELRERFEALRVRGATVAARWEGVDLTFVAREYDLAFAWLLAEPSERVRHLERRDHARAAGPGTSGQKPIRKDRRPDVPL